MASWPLIVACVLAWPAGGLAHNGVHSAGRCRVTASGPHGINVTCRCPHALQQMAGSPAIDHLTVEGCGEVGLTRVGFVPPAEQPLASSDFLLLDVRSVSLSDGAFSLQPVAGSSQAAAHPLQRLHIERARLGGGGLTAGALQGLPSLRHISLRAVSAADLQPRAIADLPSLRSLTVHQCRVRSISSGALARTPLLRQLHITDSTLGSVGSDALVVEARPAAAACDGGSEAHGAPVSLLITNTTFVSLAPNAIRVSGVQHLSLCNNAIVEMRRASLNVTARARCGRPPLLRLTDNTADVVGDGPSVVVVNDGPVVAAFVHGGNRLADGGSELSHQAAPLSQRLLLDGRFQLLHA